MALVITVIPSFLPQHLVANTARGRIIEHYVRLSHVVTTMPQEVPVSPILAL